MEDLPSNKEGSIALLLFRDFEPIIQKTSFLWANYEPQLWWFEVFECGRRLALSGILVFVAQGR